MSKGSQKIIDGLNDAIAWANGDETKARIVRPAKVECYDCDARGDVDGEECETCGGAGFLYEVSLPPCSKED